MNRRVLFVSFLIGVGVTLLLILRPTLEIAWEFRLPSKDYLLCLSTNEEGERAILIAGIQHNNYGSRDYDSYIICFDLETGEELWRRNEKDAGNLRGGKRPSSMGFDPSGNLIVGWEYFAVKEGDFEVVSKLSSKDGSVIWDWAAPSEGERPSSTGYSHGAFIYCDGFDILVKTTRSVGYLRGNSNMLDIYTVIDSDTGMPAARSRTSNPEARWQSRANTLNFSASDGSEVTWGRQGFEHIETKWFRWIRDDGIWIPQSHWEQRERI